MWCPGQRPADPAVASLDRWRIGQQLGVSDSKDETWTDEQDAQFAKRVGELYLDGHQEFEIEHIAAAEVNAADHDAGADHPPAK